MISIKLFPEFKLQSRTSTSDEEFLRVLLAAKQATQAQYVNFSVYDYSEKNTEPTHFLTYPMDWITYYL